MAHADGRRAGSEEACGARFGDISFSWAFDSGNCLSVRQDVDDEDCFDVLVRPDAFGSAFETKNRSWFRFDIDYGRQAAGRQITICVRNMSRQAGLAKWGHRPVMRLGSGPWHRLPGPGRVQMASDDEFPDSGLMRFTCTLPQSEQRIGFAMFFPWSYGDLQRQLAALEGCLGNDCAPTTPGDTDWSRTPPPPGDGSGTGIYFARELLARTEGGLRIDLITITAPPATAAPSDATVATGASNVSAAAGLQPPPLPVQPDEAAAAETAGEAAAEAGAAPLHVARADRLLVEATEREGLIHGPEGHEEVMSRLAQGGWQPDSALPPPTAPLPAGAAAELRDMQLGALPPPGALLPDLSTGSSAASATAAAASAAQAAMQAVRAGARAGPSHLDTTPGSPPSTTTATLGRDFTRSSASAPSPPGIAAVRSSWRRPLRFATRPVVFVSARVHPGETPASHALNGLLQLLTDPRDPRMAALRRLVVFKIVPMLNPDGVFRGHYRADIRGLNQNRFYDRSHPVFQTGVHSARAVWLHHAAQGRLWMYLDLHAHATKRGCFFYGNHLPSVTDQVENKLFARLCALHSPHVDYAAGVFSAKNMVSKDRKGESRAGAGRVAAFMQGGCRHSYTLECNYHGSQRSNPIYPADGDGGRAAPAQPGSASPSAPYSIADWERVGQSLLLAMVDLLDCNPWPRIRKSPLRTLANARTVVLREVCKAKDYRKQSKQLSKAWNGDVYVVAGGAGGRFARVPAMAAKQLRRSARRSRAQLTQGRSDAKETKEMDRAGARSGRRLRPPTGRSQAGVPSPTSPRDASRPPPRRRSSGRLLHVSRPVFGDPAAGRMDRSGRGGRAAKRAPLRQARRPSPVQAPLLAPLGQQRRAGLSTARSAACLGARAGSESDRSGSGAGRRRRGQVQQVGEGSRLAGPATSSRTLGSRSGLAAGSRGAGLRRVSSSGLPKRSAGIRSSAALSLAARRLMQREEVVAGGGE